MKRSTVKALQLGKPVVWQVADIVRFESSQKYTVAHRNDGKQLLITDSLRTLAVELADSFIQIHRGFLVARDALIGVKSHQAGWKAWRSLPDFLSRYRAVVVMYQRLSASFVSARPKP